MSFKEFLLNVYPNKVIPHRILAIDPGHTTGLALFEDGELARGYQASTYKGGIIQWSIVESIISENLPLNHIICESYRIYSSKSEEHINSDIPTLRIIGNLEYLAWKNNIPLHFQSASMAKGFCTDNKLEDWDLWLKGQKHSRDAIRHACYFLLFNRNH